MVIAASMPITTMTIRSSTMVKAEWELGFGDLGVGICFCF